MSATRSHADAVARSTWARVVDSAEPQTYGEVVSELDDADSGPEGTAAARAAADAIDAPDGPLEEHPEHDEAGVIPIVTLGGAGE